MVTSKVSLSRVEMFLEFRNIRNYNYYRLDSVCLHVVMLAKSDMVAKYDLSSLRKLGCGGAALGKEISQKFNARFPDVDIIQVLRGAFLILLVV